MINNISRIVLVAIVCLVYSAPARSETSGTVRILSCNIRQPLPEDEVSGNGWEARRDLCSDVIDAQQADVVCLQECRGFQLQDLKARLGGFDSYALSHLAETFTPANAILFLRSRFELISSGGFWLSETPHIAGSASWGSARPRFANWVQLKDKATGQEFRVWNTHLDHQVQKARELQARTIVQAGDVFGTTFPQILAADCNAVTTNPAVNTFRDGGWVDTYASIHGPEDPGPTYHAFRGAEREARKAGKGKIDFIFVRGPVETKAAEIVRDSRNGRYPSDHYFISADIVIGSGVAEETR